MYYVYAFLGMALQIFFLVLLLSVITDRGQKPAGGNKAGEAHH